MSENTTNPLSTDNCEPLSSEQFASMTANYKTSLGTNVDTESIWVSIYDILDLISHNRANGIRIYYGRHDDNHEQWPGRHNLIFVATRDTDNPHNPSGDNSVDLLGGEHLDPPFDKAKFTGLSMDGAPMCPPRCKT